MKNCEASITFTVLSDSNLNMKNQPHLSGTLAGPKNFFGECKRFAIAPVFTRFDAVSWFTWDAEQTDEVTGGPLVIGQAASLVDAWVGLCGKHPEVK